MKAEINGITYITDCDPDAEVTTIIYIDTNGKSDIDLVIPKEIGGKKVDRLDKHLFRDRHIVATPSKKAKFNSIRLQDNIKELLPETFEYANVNTVYLSSSITKIPGSCFENSTVCQIEYDINSVIEIGSSAFSFTTNLKEFTWPSKCHNIPNSCFYHSSIKRIKNIENVTTIGNGAFAHSHLEHIDWPIKCTKIPYSCFAGSYLEDFFVSDTKVITQIGDFAFNCTSIRSMIWPQNCKVIPQGCFAHSALGAIVGIDEVESIEDEAFAGTQLEEFCWPSSCNRIPANCFKGSRIRSVTNIDNVVEIGESAFCASEIEHFIWPSGCLTVPEKCFQNSKLKTIEGIESAEIELLAFFLCDKLRMSNITVGCSVISPLTFIGTDIKKITLTAPHSIVFLDGISEKTNVVEASECEKVTIIEPQNTPPSISENHMSEIRANFEKIHLEVGFDTIVERDMFDHEETI